MDGSLNICLSLSSFAEEFEFHKIRGQKPKKKRGRLQRRNSRNLQSLKKSSGILSAPAGKNTPAPPPPPYPPPLIIPTMQKNSEELNNDKQIK